jgi:hypothetical protein
VKNRNNIQAMKKILFCLVTITVLSALQAAFGQTGNVFHDYNGNGVKEANEPGVKGIVVKSYMQNGNNKGTAVSDSMGNYTLTPAAGTGQQLRVEFLIPASLPHYKQSFKTNTAGKAIQFVNGPESDINFAVINKAKYMYNDPLLVHSLFTFGNQVTGANKDVNVLLAMRNSWGTNGTAADGSFSTWNTNPALGLAQAKEVGSVYGIAWSARRNMVYTSAYFRQFTGFGPGGPGAIYKVPVNPATGLRSAAPSVLKDVTTLSGQSMPVDPHGSDIPTDGSAASSTDTRLGMVGKYSLGDLEISEDETKLYTINLHNREVIAINPDNGSLVGRWAIPVSGLTNTVGAVNSDDVRPFGLGYNNGQLYVGAVCTAQSTQTDDGTAAGARGNRDALHAYVWTLDEATGTFTLVMDFKIRGASARWNTWQDKWVDGVRRIVPTASTVQLAQPMLASIDFYGNDIVVGLRNRLNDQWGVNMYDATINADAYSEKWGDVLGGRYTDLTGKFTIENNGTIGNRTATGAAGVISATYNEFYRGDGSTTDSYGYENASGAFVQMGGEHLASLQNFPSYSFNLYPDRDFAGLVWMNQQTGAATKGYASYEGDLFNLPIGKTNGLGDVEALLFTAPLEIGDRVWEDSNGNGVQDAGELGKAGVTLELYDAAGTVLLATTTTDANGHYSFNETNVPGGVLPQTTYKIRIAQSQYNYGGMGALAGMIVTTEHAASAGMASYADNDGANNNGRIEVTFTTGLPGDNDLTIDFGMRSGLLSVAGISNFTVTKNGDMADVKWTTSVETDMAQFNVQRSVNGTEWKTIGQVAAKGNSVVNQYYQFTDRSPVAGATNYYRLEQVGTDREIHYSEVRKLRFDGFTGVAVYPNPAKDRVNLDVPVSLQGTQLTIKVVSTTGAVVLERNVSKAAPVETLQVQQLPQGMYHIIIRSINQAVYSTPLQVLK